MTRTHEDNDQIRRLFAGNIKRREERIDLALACLLIAKAEYPRISIEEYLMRLDQLAFDLQVEVDREGDAFKVARDIGAFLGGLHEFRGNPDDFYDPRNSYLSDVIDRRLGIPISLGVVYIEVARRAGVQLLPVSFPGHFLVKLARDGSEAFIDAFGGGRVLDRDGCGRLLEAQFGESAVFSDSMLGAATKRQVITRALQNLKAIYVHANEPDKALQIVDFLTVVAPWDLDQIRDRGLLYGHLGRTDAAVADLETFVQHAPPGPEVESARDVLRRIASR